MTQHSKIRTQCEATSFMDWAEPQEAPYTGCGYELGGLNAVELANLHTAVTTLTDVMSGLVSQPRFKDKEHQYSPAGEVLLQMIDHLANIECDTIERLKGIKTEDPKERDSRARALIRVGLFYDEPLPEVAALAAHLSAKFVQ